MTVAQRSLIRPESYEDFLRQSRIFVAEWGEAGGSWQAGSPEKKPLGDLLNLAGTDAGGANAHAASGSLHQCTDRLQIQVPPAVGHIVGVADAVSKLGAAATNFANSCHKTEISCLLKL